jgi:hypothetical protein
VKKISLVWIASVALALVAGCTPAAPLETAALPTAPAAPRDTAPPTASTLCAAPCWEGLTPGQSTLADVQRYVARTVGRNQDLRVHTPAELGIPGCHTFGWNAGGHWAHMTVENGLLVLIRPPTSPGMTLGDLVERYGPPDYLSSWLATGDAGPAYGQNAYYPKLGLAFDLHPRQETVGRVEPDTPVAIIYYSTPGDLAHLVAVQYACTYSHPEGAQEQADRDVSLARPWHGYGPVEVLKTH